ncbi:MAG TPA: hypothetical protein VHY22_04745 [Chthoniobacteraceae bacterium]|jgi:hypothetical protein|nr:hypothetical protein [Chthoniobacteraceae bacterium]
MKKRSIVVCAFGAGLLGLCVYGVGLSRPDYPQEYSGPILANASPTPAAPGVTPAATAAPPDGKETLPPDGKETLAPDGKETLGKETLPPVGEFVGERPESVDPGPNTAPAEYYKKANPLLTPPSLQNVGGPVVSPETR